MVDAGATWLDGEPAAALPLPDRGLDYGDGLFETLLLHRGRPLFPDLHLARLQRGIEQLHFPPCLPVAARHLETAADEVAGRGWEWTALRLTLTRGGGPRGYAPPAASVPRVIIRAERLARDCSRMLPPLALAVADIRWPAQPALAGIKHLNRLEQVLAARQAGLQGVDEALLLDEQDRVVSASAANLFLVAGGELVTPPLTGCGVAGTRRSLILERLAPAMGLDVREEPVSLSRLCAGQEVFVCSSLVGLRPVGRLGATSWRDHACCSALFARYLEALE